MAISAAAKSNHDQLFGDRVSTLAQSDPELIEYFDNFAFDEVYAGAARLDETLDLHTRLMVQLAAILATGGLAEFRVVGAAAVANGGVSPVELKEIVYQSVAYVGMARVFDYLHAVNDVLTGAGVELPLPGQSASTPQTRLEYGKAVQGRIVGDDAVAARLTDTPADEVHFQRYLATNCFGDTVGRGGIDLEVRELLTFSMLVALGGADAQVRGHVNGNLRVGNTRAGHSPLSGGWLTGRWRRGAPGTPTSAARPGARFDMSTPANQRKLDVVEELALLAEKSGMTMIELALAWAINHPGVTSAIIGPRTMEQLESQLPSVHVRLDTEILDRIDELVTPGVTLNADDNSYGAAELTPQARRR